MKDKNEPLNFDDLYDSLGGFGKFQAYIFTLACICSFYGGTYVLSPLIGSRFLPYRCRVPSCDNGTSSYYDDFLNYTIPWNKEKRIWDQCQRYAPVASLHGSESSLTPQTFDLGLCLPSDFHSSDVIPCDEWVHDTREFHTTISEFNLTCDRSWVLPWENSGIMMGYFIGSFLMGLISDRFGRIIGIILSSFLFLCGSLGAAFAPNFYFLIGARIVGGIGSMGNFQVAFVAAIEYIGKRWRALCGILLNVPFTVGELALILISYFIRDWRHLQIAYSIPVFFSFLYYWIMPESVRWLMVQNRKEEAFKIMKKIAKANNFEVPADLEGKIFNVDSSCEKETTKGKSILHLLKSPIIRKRSMILYYCWLVCSMMYYGLSLYVGNFSENFTLNITLVVLVEMPGYFFSAFMCNILGRKFMLLASFLGGGFACVGAALLSEDYHTWIITLNLIGKFGVSTAFGAIFFYSGEIYPTEYRAVGVGTCSMHSRIGGIIAPFISNLAYIYKPLPALIFGIMSCIAGSLIFFLPDTMGENLPQTLEESENLGKNQSWSYFATFDRKKTEVTAM